jgi:hypothetical protein
VLGRTVISPWRKRRLSAVISSSALGLEPIGGCDSTSCRAVTLRVVGTYDTAKAAPKVLAAVRGTVDVAEPAIREFVPGGSVVGLALAGVAVFGHVGYEACGRGAGCVCGCNDQFAVCEFGWPG